MKSILHEEQLFIHLLCAFYVLNVLVIYFFLNRFVDHCHCITICRDTTSSTVITLHVIV